MNTREVDKNWIAVAKDRLRQLKSGEVKAVSGEEVFKKIAAKFQLHRNPGYWKQRI